MSRSIRFNIAADVDMSDIHKLTSELKDMQKDLNKLDSKKIDLIDPASISSLRKAGKEIDNLTKNHTRLQAKNIRDEKGFKEYGRQAEAAYGRASRAALDYSRDIGSLTTKFRNIGKDISNVDRIASKMKLWPDAQREAIEQSKNALERYAKAQERLNELKRAGKANSSEFKKVEAEIKAASREMDAAAKKIDRLDSEYTEMNATLANTKNRFDILKDAVNSAEFGKEFKKMVPSVNALEDAIQSTDKAVVKFGKDLTQQQASMLKYRKTLRDSGAESKDLAQETRELSNELQKMLRLTTRDVGAQGQLSAATRAITTQKQEYAKLTTAIQRTVDASEILTGTEREISSIMSRGTASIRQQVMITGRLAEARKELNRSQSSLRSQDNRLAAQMETYAAAIDKAKAGLRELGALSGHMEKGSSEWRANQIEIKKVGEAYRELKASMADLANNQTRVRTSLRQTGNELERLDNTTGAFKQAVQEIKGTISVWTQMLAPIRNVINVAKRLADMFSKTVTAAINVAVRAMRGISQTAGSVFSGLQRALQGSGNAFNRFGSMVQNSMNRARDSMLAVTAAGYALMSIGSQVQMFGNMAFRRMGSVLDGYADYERSRIQAAIAATEFDTATGTMNVDNSLLDRIIFSMQSGRPGIDNYGNEVSYVPQWMTDFNQGKTIPVTFDSKELAQGMYYYSAAIGQPITADNAEVLMPTINTIMQMARVTNTELESAIKGVMNIAMEFGYDPRGLSAQDQLDMQTITAQVGYLANISTMEVDDIVQMFKMVGPLANQVAGGTKGAGLMDTMLLAFMSSEVGLRGGNVGRGVQQLFTSLIDPTNKMLGVMGKYFNQGEPFTAEAYKDRFFKDGALRDYNTVAEGEEGYDPRQAGILGFFTQLADQGLKGADMATMVAEMFTNNATRASIGPILGLNADKIAGMDWDEFFKGWDENPLKWLAQAAAETADSVSGWMDYMKNAWFQFTAAIITSIKGPLTGAFRIIGELLFELASFISDTPAIGRFLAGFVSVIASIASIGGTAIIASGALMILSRTILTLGGGISMFVRFIMMGALSLGIIIPAVLALAVAIGVLSKLWQKDILGMRSRWEEFTKSMSGKDIGTMFDGLSDAITAAGEVFDGFIEGIIFGNQNALAAFALWMERAFGEKFARTFLQQLQRINPALKEFGNNLRDRIPEYETGVASINDYTTAFRGFLEQIVYGSMSTDAMVAVANIGSALGLAPGELRQRFNEAADAVRTFALVTYSIGSSIVGIWRSISEEIYANLASAFNIASIEDFVSRVVSLIEGIIVGISAAIIIVLRVIERITSALASFSNRIRGTEGDTNRLTNAFRVLGIAIGLALGARFALAFAPIMGIIRFLIPAILNLAGLFVGLAGRILVAATNLGIFVVHMTLLAAKTVIVGALNAAFALLKTGIAGATIGLTGFISIGAGIVLIGALVLAGVYAWLAYTRGVEEANRVVGGFLRGLWEGLQPGILALKGLISIISLVVRAVAALSKAFLGGANDAEALGRMIGILISAAGIAGLILMVARIIAALKSLGIAFMALQFSGPIAIGLVVAAFLASIGAFETVFGVLGTIIDQLNRIQIAGVGAGDVLAAVGLGMAMTGTGRGWLARGAKQATKWGGRGLIAGAGKLATTPGALPLAVGAGGAIVLAGTTIAVGDYVVGDSPYIWDGAGVPESEKEGLYDNHLTYSKNMSDYIRNLNENNDLSPEAMRSLIITEQVRQLESGYMGGFQWDAEDPNYINAVDPMAWTIYDAKHRDTSSNQFSPRARRQAKTSSDNNNKAAKTEGESQADSYVDGFLTFLKTSGIYDLALDTGKSLFGKDFTFGDLNPMKVSQLMNDLSQVPEISEDWEKFAKLDTLPGGKAYKAKLTEWEEYNAQIKRLVDDYGYTFEDAKHAIDTEYWQAGIPIPIDPGSIDDAITEAERIQWLTEKFDELKGQWAEAATGWVDMTAPELFGALYDPLAGQGNKSLVSWMAGEGWDTISQNIPEGTGSWLNQTEFMADFALGGGMDFAGEGVYGQNVHKLLKDSGALDALSAQTGVSVDVLLEGVPKFVAPEKFQASAINDMVNMIDDVRGTMLKGSDFGDINLGEFLDTKIGTDYMLSDGSMATAIGMDWAEFNSFAVGKAIAGQDWNLATYLSESWGISIEEANAYLRSHGVDPDAVNSGMYETVKNAVLSNQGAYNVLTQEMFDWLQVATGDFSSNIIQMTEEEFMAMDDATKAILTRMGYTFVINDYVPKEAYDKAKADLDNLRQTIITNLDFGNYEMVAPGTDGIMDKEVEKWTEISRVWSDAHQDYMVTVEDINGTRIVIPAAHYDRYKESLQTVLDYTNQFKEAFKNAFDAAFERTGRVDYSLGAGVGAMAGLLTSGDAGGYGNAALGVPPEIKTKVVVEVPDIPDIDLSEAMGVPITDGAGSIKLNLQTEGFSEAQEAAQSIQKDLEAIATTPVNVKINIDTVGMPTTTMPDVQGPPAPGSGTGGAGGISIPVTADLSAFNTAIGELTTRLSMSENPMQLKIGADLSQANQDIGELVSRLALSENPVKIKIGADLTSAVTDVSTFTTALNTSKSTINVELKGDLTIDNKISYMIGRLEELAITWTATISQTGADAAATSIGNVTGVATAMAKPWIATVTVLGTATASQMIQNVINLATSVAKTWFVSVSVLVYGAQSITNLKNALDGLPTTKNVTVNTYRNEYVSTVGNNRGQGWTAAVGGRVGSSAFSNRTAFNLGQNDRYTGQYSALANRAASLPSGLTLVGEAGPELVGLSDGSYVMNAHQTASLFREGQQGSGNPLLLAAGQSSQGDTTVNNEQNLTLNFNGDMHFGSEASAREFFEQIDRRSGREFDLAKRGMRPVSDRIT